MSAREIILRNELSTVLIRSGYNVFVPVFDDGIDLIAHRRGLDGAADDTRLIQQKSRWTINMKYLDRNIWIAFPDRHGWYLAPHDTLVALGEAAGYTSARSWRRGKGGYHVKSMSVALREACKPYLLPGQSVGQPLT